MPEITGELEKIEQGATSNNAPKWTLTVAGKKHSTLRETDVAGLKPGDVVRIEYKIAGTQGQYRNIISVGPAVAMQHPTQGVPGGGAGDAQLRCLALQEARAHAPNVPVEQVISTAMRFLGFLRGGNGSEHIVPPVTPPQAPAPVGPGGPLAGNRALLFSLTRTRKDVTVDGILEYAALMGVTASRLGKLSDLTEDQATQLMVKADEIAEAFVQL